MKPDVKKLVILNLPYLIFVYLFGKCGQAYRLAAGALIVRLVVYCKGKNAKKYRKGVEYGSARWSA